MGKYNKNKVLKSSGATAPFDIFGIGPSLYIKREEKQSTFTGCVCSIIMMLIIAAVAVFYFLKFLAKEEVKISTSITTTKKFPTINLKDDKFFIDIGFFKWG